MTIHTFNSREFIFWDVFKNYYNKNDTEIYEKITALHKQTVNNLKSIGINYRDLKNTLTPQKNKKEIGFIFDSTKIEDSYYGLVVLNNFQKSLEKIKKAAIFYGDITAGSDKLNIQLKIKDSMEKEAVLFHDLNFQNSVLYFVVYINNLTETKLNDILNELIDLEYFVGYFDFTFSSYLKDVISLSIGQQLLLHNRTILQISIDGEREGVNYTHFDFEDTPFKIINIDEYQYNSFLCYKIKRNFFDMDNSDQLFSVNSVYPKTDTINDYDIVIDDKKFDYLLSNKAGSIKSIAGSNISKEYLMQKIMENINTNYLYNLELNDYDCLKFNTDLEIYDENKKAKSRIIASFEIIMNKKQIRLITLF